MMSAQPSSPAAEGVNFLLQPGGEGPGPAGHPDLTNLLEMVAAETGEVGEEEGQKINFAGGLGSRTGVGFSVTSNGPSLPEKSGEDRDRGSIQRSCDGGEPS